MNPNFQSLLDAVRREHESRKDQTISPNDRILLVDGMNLFLRAFSAVPALNEDGEHVGGIYGFLTSLGYAIKNLNPTRVIIVFDGKGGSKRRKKLYPEYKAKRSPTRKYNRALTSDVADEQKSMVIQLNRLSEYLDCLPVTVISINNVEADDVMAYIVTDLYPHSRITIMSTDKDFLQLVNDRVSVWSPTKKRLYGTENILNDYGIPVHNFLMYRMLTGDNTDNISGVRGIGLKTIQKRLLLLLGEEKIELKQLLEYAKINAEKAKILQTISESEEHLKLNYRLMQLNDVDISGNIKLRINDLVKAPINRLNMTRFQIIALEDRLYTTSRNTDVWLREVFGNLSVLAESTHSKDKN